MNERLVNKYFAAPGSVPPPAAESAHRDRQALRKDPSLRGVTRRDPGRNRAQPPSSAGA